MESSFYYKDGHSSLYNKKSTKACDPTESDLTEIIDPNIVLERLTDQTTWKKLNLPENTAVEKTPKVKLIKPAKKEYKKYSDKQREDFIDRMIESAQERGLATRYAKELGIEPRVAQRWWKVYKETEEVPYKKSSINPGPRSSFTEDHNDFLRNLVDDDSQLAMGEIVEKLAEQFENFSISKSQLNYHLKNNLSLTFKKPILESRSKRQTCKRDMTSL